jgi:flagellar assembly protein FliH
MSLFNAQDAAQAPVMTGRIIASGLSGPRETTYGELSGSPHAAHVAILESEYMERVRLRATAMAKDLLAEAQAEAARIKAEARQEGLDEGRAEVQTELDHRLAEMTEKTAAVLTSIQAERAMLWEQSRHDYLGVLKLALEKTLGIEIDQRRQEVLSSLLTQALERIDSQTMLTVTVSPEDEAVITDLIERAKVSYPALAQYRVKTDPGVNPGGIILESQEGRVDNSLESRFAGVIEIIAQFENVPNGEAGA